MNEKDNLELYEEREREILEKLGQMEETDPNRGKLLDQLDTIAKIRANYIDSELTRLNNNARNSIDEERLVIEHKKVENDKNRNTVMWVQAVLSFFGGAGLTVWSYHMDDKKYSYKDLKQFGLKLIDRIRGR